MYLPSLTGSGKAAQAVIDNAFVNSARRVEVTIRSSDYAFHAQRCGQWRPT